MDEIEQKFEKAQDRIANSVFAIGTFLAGKAAEVATSAADLVEKTAKSITGKDPSEFEDVATAAKKKATETADEAPATAAAPTTH